MRTEKENFLCLVNHGTPDRLVANYEAWELYG